MFDAKSLELVVCEEKNLVLTYRIPKIFRVFLGFDDEHKKKSEWVKKQFYQLNQWQGVPKDLRDDKNERHNTFVSH